MPSSTISRRFIGDTPVSALGLGCMSIAIPNSKGLPNDEESLQVLTAAADLGINFWITSDAYGKSESVLGRWFRETGRRDEIFLVTHFGVKHESGKAVVNGTPEYVKECCEKSLKTLGTDRIDLYIQHRVDPKVPIERTIGAMKELVLEGKVKYLGISECSAATLRRANKIHPIAATEQEFSPFALDIEDPQIGILKTARELGTKIIAYSPLGRGFMTGTIKSRADMDPADVRLKYHPRFSEENFADNVKLVEQLSEIAKEKGCTPGQSALAWVLAQGEDFIPVPGTKRVKYLKDNAGALQVDFSKADENRVRKIIESVGGSKGARYPPGHLEQCFGNTPEFEE